jgi:hypothetical protein
VGRPALTSYKGEQFSPFAHNLSEREKRGEKRRKERKEKRKKEKEEEKERGGRRKKNMRTLQGNISTSYLLVLSFEEFSEIG